MPNLGKRKVANKSNVEQAAHVKQAWVAAAAAAAAAAADAAADNAASFASASVSSTASSAATSRALRQLAEYGGVGPQRQPAADGGARARNLPPRLRSPSASPPRERAVRQRTEGAAGPSGGAPRQADRPTRPCARMRHARARRCSTRADAMQHTRADATHDPRDGTPAPESWPAHVCLRVPPVTLFAGATTSRRQRPRAEQGTTQPREVQYDERGMPRHEEWMRSHPGLWRRLQAAYLRGSQSGETWHLAEGWEAGLDAEEAERVVSNAWRRLEHFNRRAARQRRPLGRRAHRCPHRCPQRHRHRRPDSGGHP